MYVCIVMLCMPADRVCVRMQTKATTSDASLCSRADELRQANVPLHLVSGWLDSTAAAAINLYHYCGQAPGTGSFREHLHQNLLILRPATWIATSDQRVASSLLV